VLYVVSSTSLLVPQQWPEEPANPLLSEVDPHVGCSSWDRRLAEHNTSCGAHLQKCPVQL
jgi:hypothetical protein